MKTWTADVFDSELGADELAAIDGLDREARRPEPSDVTLESFGFPVPEA